MSEDFLDEVHSGAMPAAVMLWTGAFFAMFYAAGTMIAAFYEID